MPKAMLFIDGTWLYSNTPKLADAYGKRDFQVDFGKLPKLLARELSRQRGTDDIDVVRTYLFGSYASNYDLRDEEPVLRRLDFFSMLKEEYHYEIDIHPVNFRGRRLRKSDRDVSDTFEPKEKCVDISLATAALYYAAIPHAYDIAVAVVGDQDFKPVFQHVRRLGKRVAIASIKGSCSPEFADPKDEARVKDFDMVWLNDWLQDLELKYEGHHLLCASPGHRGDRKVWTTFHPRKGQKYYCDTCRSEFTKQKQEAQQEFISSQVDLKSIAQLTDGSGLDRTLRGSVSNKVSERGYGFIKASDGHDYFFHLTDLDPSLEFSELQEGFLVAFQVKKEPGYGKAGAAHAVRAHCSNGNALEDAKRVA